MCWTSGETNGHLALAVNRKAFHVALPQKGRLSHIVRRALGEFFPLGPPWRQPHTRLAVFRSFSCWYGKFMSGISGENYYCYCRQACQPECIECPTRTSRIIYNTTVTGMTPVCHAFFTLPTDLVSITVSCLTRVNTEQSGRRKDKAALGKQSGCKPKVSKRRDWETVRLERPVENCFGWRRVRVQRSVTDSQEWRSVSV